MLEAHLLRFRCTLKKPQVLKISGSLHYCMPHIRIMAFGHKTHTFFIIQPIFAYKKCFSVKPVSIIYILAFFGRLDV